MTCLPRFEPLVLTGPIQAGKSTLVRRLIDALHITPAGYFTRSQRLEGKPQRLFLSDWQGKRECCFATRNHDPRSPFPFDVDEHIFRQQAVEILREARNAPLCIIDELGLAERHVEPFVRELRTLLASPTRLLLVVQARSLDFWLDNLHWTRRPVFTLAPGNRDALFDQMLHHLQTPLPAEGHQP